MSSRSTWLASAAVAMTVATAAHASPAPAKPIVVRFVEPPFERLDAAGRQVNACALRLREREFALARASCDRAVQAARNLHERKASFSTRNLRAAQALAAALTNRASLELLTGNLERAQADIAAAMNLRPKHAFVDRNQLVIEAAGREASVNAR